MYWDETFASWDVFGVTTQPTAVLMSAAGEPIAGWVGQIPEDEVLRLAAESEAAAATGGDESVDGSN